MKLWIQPSTEEVNTAAAALLMEWFGQPGVRNIMLAGGNTPLELYGLIGLAKPELSGLTVFALDEYAGVPPEDPRNCANLIRRTAVEPWGIPPEQYHCVDSTLERAEASVAAHEELITRAGGIDIIVLGLGQNGHLGFNEPGSLENSGARVLALDTISIEANRKWFGGDYAPANGATVGMKTILAARQVLLLACGAHKTAAAAAMLEGPRSVSCPASLLQGHPDTHVILDAAAASGLKS